MPENHGERDGFDEPDDFGERQEFGDRDEFDDDFGDAELDDDGYAAERAESAWPAPVPPPPGYPPPPGGWHRNGGSGARRRGLLLAATAVAAAAFAFAVADAAIHDAPGRPAASATPSGGGYGGDPSGRPGGGTQLAPQGGGAPSLPSGAMMQLEIGGPVTAVSATSITVGSGDRAVTAAVTSATKITGKVTSIGGIKVGDLVSALITGTNGKLTADSIQDPASLPSGLGQ